LDLPLAAKLFQHDNEAASLVAHGPQASLAARERLDRLGIERLELQQCTPLGLLEVLAVRGCNQVLWECGPTLAAAAVRQGCVQQVAAVIAPTLLGGEPARTPLGQLDLTRLDQAPRLTSLGWRRLGPDLLGLHGFDFGPAIGP
jgi:diaminohydroxyphosphoribosylaminopyrimidine deaminase/5-amino-6-(5-phosphoribosylamino)uracil reductase